MDTKRQCKRSSVWLPKKQYKRRGAQLPKKKNSTRRGVHGYQTLQEGGAWLPKDSTLVQRCIIFSYYESFEMLQESSSGQMGKGVDVLAELHICVHSLCTSAKTKRFVQHQNFSNVKHLHAQHVRIKCNATAKILSQSSFWNDSNH